MRVPCAVGYDEIEDEESGRYIPGVRVQCGRCGATQTAFGQHTGSVKRALVSLRERCPEDESNFYEVGE